MSTLWVVVGKLEWMILYSCDTMRCIWQMEINDSMPLPYKESQLANLQVPVLTGNG